MIVKRNFAIWANDRNDVAMPGTSTDTVTAWHCDLGAHTRHRAHCGIEEVQNRRSVRQVRARGLALR
jgi:hypothetical protein